MFQKIEAEEVELRESPKIGCIAQTATASYISSLYIGCHIGATDNDLAADWIRER